MSTSRGSTGPHRTRLERENNMAERDPRLDPRPGDVLEKRFLTAKQWRIYRREVVSVEVGSFNGPVVLYCSVGNGQHNRVFLSTWNCWAADAKVESRG